MEILAADGRAESRRALCEAIEVLGHWPLEATDAEEVWNALMSHHPDLALIVLDWDLPGAGGSQFLRRILADHRFARIPVMVLFGEGQTGHALEAFQAGATECVSREATGQDLLTRMLESLSRAA